MICRFSVEAERREQTPVDNLFITEYLPEAGGQEVAVYLYGLMQCYYASMREISISEALSIPPESVQKSFEYWQDKRLVRIIRDEPLTVEYLLATTPQVTTETPQKHHAFVRSLNALTAPRQFDMRELKVVFEFIETYGMEEGAVLELVSYCMQLKGRSVSANYLKAVAQSWCEEGVITTEQANRYLEDYASRRHGASEVLKRWNKRRKPTLDEMNLYDRWIKEWGFDSEAILAVCPELVSVGTPTFAILNDRLYELYSRHKVRKEDIVEESKDYSSDREFARLVFSRMGKIEPPTKSNVAQLAAFVNDRGLPKQVVLLAAEASADAERPFGLLKTILKDWCERGINTVQQAEKELVDRERRPKGRKKDMFDYEKQRKLSNADVASMYVNLDEDI
ncbi:MAG: DnaD domain protein [Clostridia bacterium]|nr:DnaD domain protein [Clostridia bacterium]